MCVCDAEEMCVCACVCVSMCVRALACVCVCLKLPSGVQCCVDPSDPESKVRGDLSSPSHRSDFITVATLPLLDLS